MIYGQGANVRANALLPRAVPVMGTTDWEFWTTSLRNDLGFSQSGTDPLHATMKLTLTGTPEPELLANVRYRLGWASTGPGGNSRSWRCPRQTPSSLRHADGPDDHRLRLPAAYHRGHDLQHAHRLSGWMNAPVSVAGKSFSGTLDVSTVAQ